MVEEKAAKIWENTEKGARGKGLTKVSGIHPPGNVNVFAEMYVMLYMYRDFTV